jgi:protein-disulfide isomerase
MRILRSLVLAPLLALPLAQAYVQSSAQSIAPVSAAPSTAQGAIQPVSILVFSDFECPYSSQTFLELQKLKAAYPGQIRITYKQSPLSIHPDAPLAHRAALAAARQGKFDAMAELLYANQKPQDLASLTSFARQIHLDIPRFRRDLNSASVAAELEADLEESRAFAIDQTPTIFINGKTLYGYQPEAAVASLIDKSMAQSVAASTAAQDDGGAPIDPALLAQIQTSPTAAEGPGDAPLTIIEFTDFQCPFCRAAVAPMEQFMAARGKQVRWIVRAFPLDFHPDSELATEAALAAGEQGKFWQMHDLLFANQSALKLENLRSYAEQLHLDMPAFEDALSTHRFAGQIAADRALGNKAGVGGTPTFIIDGQLVSGARSLPELNQIADSSAAKAAGKPAPQVAALPVLQVAAPNQQVIGPATDVPLTLTWFTDVRSPLAARQADLIRELAKRYDGKVRVLFRAFPLESHEDGRVSSAALLASLKQGKFWPMFDAIAERRDTLDRAKLLSIAESAGLDQTRFATDLDASAVPIGANIEEATRRGILGAPVLFVNKQRVDGLQSKQFYVNIFDSELQASTSTEASLAP